MRPVQEVDEQDADDAWRGDVACGASRGGLCLIKRRSQMILRAYIDMQHATLPRYNEVQGPRTGRGGARRRGEGRVASEEATAIATARL